MFSRKPKLPIDTDTAEWIENCFGWMMAHQDGHEDLLNTPLVLPSDEFFAPTRLSGHALAEHIFDRVREYADMVEWPCELQRQDPDIERNLGNFVMIQGGPTTPLGTFGMPPDKDRPVITYNPSLLKDTLGMVATLAHELAHYLIAMIPEEPPGGRENHEFATDIAAVFMGFGIFLVNSSFRFAQFGDAIAQGWSSHRQGYMSGRDLTYALALFVVLKGEGREKALSHLQPDQRSTFKKSVRYLLAEPQIVETLKNTAKISYSPEPH
jgi:hypothetical protein